MCCSIVLNCLVKIFCLSLLSQGHLDEGTKRAPAPRWSSVQSQGAEELECRTEVANRTLELGIYWNWLSEGFLLPPHQCPLKHPPRRCLFREQPQDALACFFLWVPAVNSWHLSTIDYEVCWQATLTVQSSGDRRAGFNNHPLLRVSFRLSEECKAFSLGRYWHFVHKVNNSCFAPSQEQLRSQLLCFKAAEHWSLITASSLLATWSV